MKTAISLFASSGIGDIALRKQGVHVLVASELLPDRCSMFQRNYPETLMIQGDIRDNQHTIITETQDRLKGSKLDYALVTPPCQGMSKNGRGKLLSEIKAGRRPSIDERNLLILPALEILKVLKPDIVIFENVSEMLNTLIPFNNELIPIVDIIRMELKDWVVNTNVLEFANYGIPQRRQRLITIASKKQEHINYFNQYNTLCPKETHSSLKHTHLKPWITVRNTISCLEALDGKYKIKSTSDPLHRVSKLDDKKYWWIQNTKEGNSAFNNQCVSCGFDKIPIHKNVKNIDGVNKSSTQTPIFCPKCKELLPRPTTHVNGVIQLMKGFTSAYKRMEWDLPASAITRNFPYACSDNKVHPQQHRTLSIKEVCMLHTIEDNDYIFEYVNGLPASTTSIRDTLGESVPPKILKIIIDFLNDISLGKINHNATETQAELIFS